MPAHDVMKWRANVDKVSNSTATILRRKILKKPKTAINKLKPDPKQGTCLVRSNFPLWFHHKTYLNVVTQSGTCFAFVIQCFVVQLRQVGEGKKQESWQHFLKNRIIGLGRQKGGNECNSSHSVACACAKQQHTNCSHNKLLSKRNLIASQSQFVWDKVAFRKNRQLRWNKTKQNRNNSWNLRWHSSALLLCWSYGRIWDRNRNKSSLLNGQSFRADAPSSTFRWSDRADFTNCTILHQPSNCLSLSPNRLQSRTQIVIAHHILIIIAITVDVVRRCQAALYSNSKWQRPATIPFRRVITFDNFSLPPASPWRETFYPVNKEMPSQSSYFYKRTLYVNDYTFFFLCFPKVLTSDTTLCLLVYVHVELRFC